MAESDFRADDVVAALDDGQRFKVLIVVDYASRSLPPWTACRASAVAKGWDVVEVFEDVDVSAYDRRIQRPAFEALRETVLDGRLDGVLLWKLDRPSDARSTSSGSGSPHAYGCVRMCSSVGRACGGSGHMVACGAVARSRMPR